jgi:nucleotide-binding universal stress UspA family protein
MFQRILLPFDGSHASYRGLEEAIKLAAGQPVTLHLLHVVDDLAATPGMDGGNLHLCTAGREPLEDTA